MSKKRIFIDMDGVLCNYDKKAAETPQYKKDRYNECHGIPGFYRDLEPMPGAIEAWNWLSENFDVYIASSPSWSNPSSWIDKRLWVANHLGPTSKKRLILTHNKGLLEGDILIDDNTWNGVEDFKGTHIHFGQDRFKDWDSVLKFIQSIFI